MDSALFEIVSLNVLLGGAAVGARVPIWLSGSSLFGGPLAGHLGLQLAIAAHCALDFRHRRRRSRYTAGDSNGSDIAVVRRRPKVGSCGEF